MKAFYSALLILFVIAVGVFCFQNQESVSIAYLDQSISLPMPLVVLAVYILGMLSGGTVLSLIRRSLRKATQSDN